MRASSALVSARSFTIRLLVPAVEVVIVVHGLVTRGAFEAADEDIRRVVSQRERPSLWVAPEVLVNGLAHDLGECRTAAARLELELTIRTLRKSEIGRDQLRHRNIAISDQRDTFK
jgi:hypothetical protein